MGMASNLFAAACRVTAPKPVKWSVKDADGEELSLTVAMNAAPRSYSQTDIRAAAVKGALRVGATVVTASGVKESRPRTDASGEGAGSIIDNIYGVAIEPAAERATVNAERSSVNAA